MNIIHVRLFVVVLSALMAALSPSPAATASTSVNWRAISSGSFHTCGVKSDGSAWCWGNNGYGQLGDGTTASSSAPVQVIGISGVTQISVGLNQTCALNSSNEGYCWGAASRAVFGTDGGPDILTPRFQIADAKSIATGSSSTCAVKIDKTVWCWGENLAGQLGDGTTFTRNVKVQVRTCWREQGDCFLSDAVAVQVGWDYACAITEATQVRCWGSGYNGVTGNLTQNDQSVAFRVQYYAPLPLTAPSVSISGVTLLSIGRYHACAIRANHTLWCWGRNLENQLGDGSTTSRYGAKQVLASGSGLLQDVADVSVGKLHTCAVTISNSTLCWGFGAQGALGRNSESDAIFPTQVSTPAGLVFLSQGGYPGATSCGIDVLGRAWCWGDNANGQIGDGTMVNRKVPTGVGTLLLQTITFNAIPDRTLAQSLTFSVAASTDSGLDVFLAASGACSVLNKSVTITGAGMCSLTASQVGDGTYAAAADVVRSFAVWQLSLPANTLAPSISGTAKVATQLTGSPGTWGGYPAPSTPYAYAWFSCTGSGSASATKPSNCTAISGATASTFTPTSTQVGKYLRLKVTASNTSGSTFYFSAATAKVIR